MRIALFVVVALAACASPGEQATPSAQPDVQGTWQLTSGRTADGPVPILDDHPITLTIAGTEISGRAACNYYGSRITVREGRLSIEETMMTAMGCDDAVAASESAYMAALAEIDAIGREENFLVMRGPGVELLFEALPPPPTAELADTAWVLETIFAGDVASAAMGERGTLEIRSDGTMAGSTGCRTFNGTWIENGEQILATTLAMDDRLCPPDLAEQDAHVTSVIGDGFVPSVEGELLTLRDPGGVGLVYRADP